MSKDTQPPEGQITPEDVKSQFLVVRTKDDQVAVQFPEKEDGSIDIFEAIKLIAAGLNFVVAIAHQQAPPEKPRIVLAPAVPKEFLTRGLKSD